MKVADAVAAAGHEVHVCRYREARTLLRWLGEDLRGLRVLDVAGGDGYWAARARGRPEAPGYSTSRDSFRSGDGCGGVGAIPPAAAERLEQSGRVDEALCTRLDESERRVLVKARAQRFLDTAALFQALGGGWWNRSDAAAPVSAAKGIS